MKITKYEHACLDIADGDNRLIIDPGIFTSSLKNIAGVTAVVITHIHSDHFDPEKLKAIVEANPEVKIFTTEEVSKEFDDHVEVAQPGKPYTFGGYSLEFFGQKHAEIDPQTPVAQNIGVLVNNSLYYPGDSYTVCSKPFDVLAVPASAPWYRVGESLPLFENSQCKTVFPTHNALLSEAGHKTTNIWLEKFAERNSKQFVVLETAQSLETN